MLAGAYQNATATITGGTIPMPWNGKLPRGGSFTTASPSSGVLGGGPLVYPSAAGVSAAAWGRADAFIDYTR